jgi:hypothetical protein
MKKFSRRMSFPSLWHSPSKRSLNIDDVHQASAENEYHGVAHMRSRSAPEKKTPLTRESSFEEESRSADCFCKAFEDIR